MDRILYYCLLLVHCTCTHWPVPCGVDLEEAAACPACRSSCQVAMATGSRTAASRHCIHSRPIHNLQGQRTRYTETPVNSVLTHCFLQAHSQSLFQLFNAACCFFLYIVGKMWDWGWGCIHVYYHLFQCLFKRGKRMAANIKRGQIQIQGVGATPY